MLQVPVFHVNGEDPEAVAQVVRLGMEYRQKFKRDVVIDMYGYRRLGHNEGDEPSFTHPVLYRAIEQRKSVREGYLDHLLTLKGLTREEADAIRLATPRATGKSALGIHEQGLPPAGVRASRHLERLSRGPGKRG
jgi:2-oxoglutarate dehydrogenase complex dehydrogenase (E1) component-like enzyme